MSTVDQATELYTKYGDQYIAVNEVGQLRSRPPMRRPDSKYGESYQGPIDAGLSKGHIVFYIHGGLNDLPTVTKRIIKFDEEFKDEPWHIIHLAWDTSVGSSIDDNILKLVSIRSLRNLLRLARIVFPWNWRSYKRRLLGPAAYFGGTIWSSQYDTALAATSKPRMLSRARNNGFYRALKYLEEKVRPGDGIKISFVVHSAGSIVSNYLLNVIASDFKNLRDRVTNYILLAPACHVTQFEEAASAVDRSGRTLVMVLPPALEEADRTRYSSPYSSYAAY